MKPDGKETKLSVRKSKSTLNVKPGEIAGEEFTVMLPHDIPLKFRWCPPGSFVMGEGRNEREVSLSNGFWIAEIETTGSTFFSSLLMARETEGRFNAVVGRIKLLDENAAKIPDMGAFLSKGLKAVVDDMSWFEAITVAQIFNAHFGMQEWEFRLPTAAEWEYACQAGDYSPENIDEIHKYAWLISNSPRKYSPHQAAQLIPNAWGLYDMRGNAEEWVMDWADANEYDTEVMPHRAGTDPIGPRQGNQYTYHYNQQYKDENPNKPTTKDFTFQGEMKLLKGGNFQNYGDRILAKSQSRRPPDKSKPLDRVGFRLVLAPAIDWAGLVPQPKKTEGQP